jgi:CHRD domain
MLTRVHRAFAISASFIALACGPALAQGKPLHADLSGANEVPLAGDPNGTGRAVIRVNPGQGTVCYDITVENVDPIAAAHIHIGAFGIPGAIVVPLPPSGGTISGCQDGVDRDLAKAIMKDPEAYYVNVHNAPFPFGAARGQLEKGF